MPILDTSALIALYSPDDQHHPTAVEKTRGATRLIIPAVVVTEFLAIVRHRTRQNVAKGAADQEARESLKDLLAQPAMVVETGFDARRAHELFLSNPALSYVDAVGVAMAQAAGDVLVTFDVAQQTALSG